MLYVEQSLGPNEVLVYVGRFHWFLVVKAYLSIVWGMAGSVLVVGGSVYMYHKMGWLLPSTGLVDSVRGIHVGLRIAAFGVFALGLLQFAQMMITRVTTEIAITNTRLVYKRGLIARQVGEMSIDRIESVNVMQTMMGRLFNYGRLAIHGTGVGEVILPAIADPVGFRKAIEQARGKA